MRRSTVLTARTARIAVLVTSLAMVLAATVVAPAAARSPNADAAAKARAEHQRIVKYWTAERIAAAQPRDFVRTPNGDFQAGKAPQAKPPKPGGGGTVTGASWSGGGPVVQRTGKVVFTMGGGDYVCSASTVNDSRAGYSLVLTAAHCAYDEAAEAFATNWTYIPSFDTAPTFDCVQSTYGCWTAVGLVVHSGYATAGGFNTQATVHDFAIAIVGAGGKNQNTQLDSLGSYPIAYPAISTGGSVHSFGYPAAGRYKGRDLTYCAGPTFDDVNNGNATWGIACNMTGGSSGGPWLAGFSQAGGGTLTSLNSYGYGGLSNMYGPKFNSDTQAVVNEAATRTSNFIVP